MRETFRSLSAAEFFYRNREIAGFSNPSRALYQTVRELVENALDACDSHEILPSLYIGIKLVNPQKSFYKVTVSDNGIGIPPHYVPYAFGKVLFGSKYKLRQTRGMFGLGAKMAILYGQLTTGKPVEVETTPLGSRYRYYFKIMVDIKRNEPIILERKMRRLKKKSHGTAISVVVEGDWSRAKNKIYEYIKRTAIAIPYASITFVPPDSSEATVYKRVTNKMPPPPKEVKPHPHGIDIEMLKMLISVTEASTLKEFLAESFQGVGPITAEKFLRDIGFDPNMSPHSLTAKGIKALTSELKKYNGFKPPRADALSPLGEDLIIAGLKRVLNPEFVTAVTRKPSAYLGHPFIVEVGIAYGGKIPSTEEPQLYRFANKIPLLYDEKADVSWKIVSNAIDWKAYGAEFPAPLVIFVHICSTKVPYKGVGKESIADVPEIEKEIKNAIREAARKLRTYIFRKRKEEELKKKTIVYVKYIPEIASSLAVLSKPSNTEINGGGLTVKELEKMLLNLVREKLQKLGASINVESLRRSIKIR
ncbi:MAG: DNA topoisomerase VI subunit B [Desulfurococcales archaeon ex4484_217_1]|nr:MAG: DNA topoisomerase VI subunit B [Desulfurococcales archaeon ex4484_217_1]